MQKYLALARANVAQYLVYRLSFVLWRFRVVLSLILTYFLWATVYQNRLNVFGYTRGEMLTYVILIYLVGDLVFASRIADLASQIRNGEIINSLLKPFSFFQVMFTREVVDKALNLGFSVLEVIVLVWLARPMMAIHWDILTLISAALSLLMGIFISFFISFAISLLAFWTTEVWAPRFVFMVLITVLAGSYFPLHVFPPQIYQLLLLTPFPYLAYLPVKILVEGFIPQQTFLLGIAFIWTILSYWLARALWHKGMREFSFFGR